MENQVKKERKKRNNNESALKKSVYNQKGEEIMDPKPKRMPIGFKKPEMLSETIARLVRTELSKTAQDHGYETFDEADDFDVDDDFDPSTPYEENFDHHQNLEHDKKLLKESKKLKDKPKDSQSEVTPKAKTKTDEE